MALTPRRSPPAPALSVAFAVGMLLIYFGRRIATGTTGNVATIAGLLVAIAAAAARVVRARRSTADRREPELVLLGLYLLALLAVGAYFVDAVVFPWATGRALARVAPRIATTLQMLWPALWATGALPIAFVEMSVASMRNAPVWERGRVRAATASGVGVALVLVFGFAIVFAGRASDVRWDLSYFRMARAGTATHNLVRSLDRPIEVLAFFAPGNEVGTQVDEYFADLRRDSRLLAYRRVDRDLDPGSSTKYGVDGNGIITIVQGSRHENLGLALEIERARGDLRKLDAEVHRRLLKLTRPTRVVYFTQGHEEDRSKPVDETDRRRTNGALAHELEESGWIVKELGLAQGLAVEVPGDAALVAVLGPRRPFMPQEAEVLTKWVERGGRLLLALDPEAGIDHQALLAPLGLSFTPLPLVNDAVYWRRSSQPSERANLITLSFGAHLAVAGLAKVHAPLVLLGVGPLATKPGAAAGSIEFTVKTDPNTWLDRDIDFTQGQDETRSSFDVAAAVSFRGPDGTARTEGRAVVLGDADALSTLALGNPGNRLLFTDSVSWLSGDDALAGAVNSEEDVPLTHTRRQDTTWFYTTTFLVPAIVVLGGVFATRRRRVGRPRRAAARPDDNKTAPPSLGPQQQGARP